MKVSWIITASLLAGLSLLAEPVDYAVDQVHDQLDTVEDIHSLIAYPTITQEFTPTHRALNVVEIYTRDWSSPTINGVGGTLQVTIREDTTNGTVLAVSEPLELPDGWEGLSRFNFPELVWLTPGNRYALEVRLLTGNNWGVDSYGEFAPPYAGGRYFVGPHLVTSADMWFRAGVRPPATKLKLESERVIAWPGIRPLPYRVWLSTTLTNWQLAGIIQSTADTYRFTNAVSTAPQVFFKVSQP